MCFKTPIQTLRIQNYFMRQQVNRDADIKGIAMIRDKENLLVNPREQKQIK